MNDKQETASSPLVSLTEEERECALARLRLLRPHLEDGIPLTRTAKQQGLPLRTARRWLALYHEHGLAGLVRHPRNDRGLHRRLMPEVKALIEGLALRSPPPTAAFVHRQCTSIAVERGWKPPSYRAVYDAIMAMDPALLTLAHEGSKAYRETFDLLHRREATKPNEIWQADHCKLDIYLLNDKGQPERPWLTVIIDDHSRAIAGFGLSFRAPSILQTSLVLRQAIWRKLAPHWHICGIPEVFYTDHGSDFTSNHLEQVAADLKMRLVFSQPGVPRGRGKIERFFRTLNQLFLCHLPGYAPAGSNPRPFLSLSAFDVQLQRFLLEEYHGRIHGKTRMLPQAKWGAGGFLPRLPESLEQLDMLLLTVAKTRQVRPDGIHFHGFRYLDPNLAAYVGESVIIRYDPRDMAEIRVFYQDHFLCRAICPELAGETVRLRDILQARNQRRRKLRQTLRERVQMVNVLLEVRRGYGNNPELAASGATESIVAEQSPQQEAPKLKRYLNE
jgi:putative transposase